MPTIENWTKEDFLALLLCYAANADMNISEEEAEVIVSKAGAQHFRKAKATFKKLSDNETIEMILALKDKYFPGENGKEILHKELQAVFEADGHVDSTERMIAFGLERLF
jgi:hypothetical protein